MIEHSFEVPGSAPVVVTYDPEREWVLAAKVGGVDMMLPGGCPLVWFRFGWGQLPQVFWTVAYELGPPAAWWFETPRVVVVPVLAEPWANLVAAVERLEGP